VTTGVGAAVRPPVEPEPAADRDIARRTAQLLGAALSLLFVSLLVVQRTESVLDPAVVASGASFAAVGVIELTDDDRGAPLFLDQALLPGDVEVRCIGIAYTGSVPDVTVTMQADATGPLADDLQVRVLAGEGGGAGSCDGFVPGPLLFEGSLAAFSSETAARPLVVLEGVGPGTMRTLAIEVALPTTAVGIEGEEAEAEFRWVASDR
jgi:hypothetical protein